MSSRPILLIADDDEMVRDFFATLFEREGFKVLRAADGEAALQQFRHNAIRLVLLDLYMPGMEGVETLLQIKKHYPATKVIIVSGAVNRAEPEHDMLASAVKLGADDALSKTVAPKILIQAVRLALNGVWPLKLVEARND